MRALSRLQHAGLHVGAWAGMRVADVGCASDAPTVRALLGTASSDCCRREAFASKGRIERSNVGVTYGCSSNAKTSSAGASNIAAAAAGAGVVMRTEAAGALGSGGDVGDSRCVAGFGLSCGVGDGIERAFGGGGVHGFLV